MRRTRRFLLGLTLLVVFMQLIQPLGATQPTATSTVATETNNRHIHPATDFTATSLTNSLTFSPLTFLRGRGLPHIRAILFLSLLCLFVLIVVCCCCYHHCRRCTGGEEDSIYLQATHQLDADELELQRNLENGEIELTGIDATTTTSQVRQESRASSVRSFTGRMKEVFKLGRNSKQHQGATYGLVNGNQHAVNHAVSSTVSAVDDDFFTDEPDVEVANHSMIVPTTATNSRTTFSSTSSSSAQPVTYSNSSPSRNEEEILATLRREAALLAPHDVSELSAHDLEQLDMLTNSTSS